MRLQRASASVVYDAASRFVDAALRADDSLFTPGTAVWSRDNLDALHRYFVERPDDSSDSFLTKFRRQLEDAPDLTIQLAAEALFVHFLIAVMSGEAKRAVINPVLGWMRTPIAIPSQLDAALDEGIASPGAAFHSGDGRPRSRSLGRTARSPDVPSQRGVPYGRSIRGSSPRPDGRLNVGLARSFA
jgi:hypothetical protein